MRNIFVVLALLVVTGCYYSSYISDNDIIVARGKCVNNGGVRFYVSSNTILYKVECNNGATFFSPVENKNVKTNN